MPTDNTKNKEIFAFLSKLSDELNSYEEVYAKIDPYYFSYDWPGSCAQALDAIRQAKKKLAKLNFVSIDDLKSVKALITLESFFSQSDYLDILCFFSYKAFIDPELLAHAKLELQLDILEEKSRDLACRGHQLAATEVKSVVSDLRDLNQWHFSEKKIDHDNYKVRALQIIKASRPILETHRGCKQILGNLILLIFTMGTIFILHKAISGDFLFFKQTDSAKQLDKLEQVVDFSCPKAVLAN
ncbi:MAG: hypothetical protein O7C59_06465 [Rickettsia endosymbiont of Ixodes persulcatus]|nr:hypothetical protein [Rickettsia endosymbiont of Ixodes persulcatus]